ncbi:MAG: hypothetical protein R6V12_10825 [Candidatus Hydrogenedentota bacterium]
MATETRGAVAAGHFPSLEKAATAIPSQFETLSPKKAFKPATIISPPISKFSPKRAIQWFIPHYEHNMNHQQKQDIHHESRQC